MCRSTLVRALAVLVLLSPLAGCSAPNDTGPGPSSAASPASAGPGAAVRESLPWGELAVAWWDAMGAAAAEGAEHMAGFLAADLVWEERILGMLTRNEQDWIDEQLRRFGGPFPWEEEGFLVSADELLGRFTVPLASQGLLEAFLDRMAIGPEGVTHWVTAASYSGCLDHQPWRCEFDSDEFAARYVALWNGAPHLDAGTIYAPRATISDTLLGESVSGLGAIARSVASKAWPSVGRMRLLPLTDAGAHRAVFVALADAVGDGPEEIRFLVEADAGSGCPGLMGVVLAMADGRVAWERRYHAVDAVRRCFDRASLEAGWWDAIETPGTVVAERTGVVSYGDMEITVHNGIPALDRFVRWGLSRFESAGLTPPHQVESVTFLRARVTCLNLGGIASMGESTHITLCATPDDICVDDACLQWSPRARRVWLHELAHPWILDHVDDATRAEFLELVGLPRWSDGDDPWRRRGLERAADTLAYGLMDEPVALVAGLHGDCATRDAGFRILTGTDPVAPCMSASGTGGDG